MAQVLIDNGQQLDKFIGSLKNLAPTDDEIKKLHDGHYSAALLFQTSSDWADAVTRGAQGQITLGPAELREPWCTGMYEARLLELSSAHCTGSAPCPQYVRVVGIIGRATFTVHRS